MWVVKFLLEPVEWQETVISRYAKKFNLSVSGFPLAFYKEKPKYFFTASGFIQGSDNNVKAALKEMKKDLNVRNVECAKDLITIEYEGDTYVKELYDPHFINISPIKTSSDGKELWEVGCWNRDKL